MIELDFDHSNDVAKWVGYRLGIKDFGPCAAIGVIKDNKPIFGIVYGNCQCLPNGKVISLEISVASVDKTWANRYSLYKLFAYPFIQLDVKRVQATVARRNNSMRRFLERLGFKFEGIAREGWRLGGDAAIYSMLKPECKWL